TPTPHTTSTAIKKVCSLVDILRAHVCFLEAPEHDRQVAAISHLPFLASIALMNTVAEDNAWRETALLAASGFSDVSRLAAGSPEMYRDICFTNSIAIVRQLDDYITTYICYVNALLPVRKIFTRYSARHNISVLNGPLHKSDCLTV
ncbi:MAG TPA: prephenate dehydrogenase dimerization domain-containing protein, partial [Ktedonobacteraceae bacterium]|nr:prephenate dehydrogenase dimerization domain-containing protein [Ktedonobacteraceae bacterium]